MATASPGLPLEPRESFAADLAGIPSFFIDPQAAAKRVHSKWFWVGPLILFAVVSLISSILLMPVIQHVMQIAPVPENTDPAAYQKGIEMAMKVQNIAMYLSPLIVALLFAFQTLLLFMMTAIMTIKATFRQLFNLVAGCSIIQLLSAVAGVIILKTKTDISTMAELQPALGLDIFLPEGTNKLLMAFLGYFSIFQIWWIVMLVLVLSAAFKIGKGKALAVVLPLVIVTLLWKVGAAAMQR